MLERGGACLGLAKELVVTRLLAKLEGCLGVVELGARGVDARHVLLGAGELGHRGPGGLGVVPEAGLAALALKLLGKRAALVYVQVALDLLETRGKDVELVSRDVGH